MPGAGAGHLAVRTKSRTRARRRHYRSRPTAVAEGTTAAAPYTDATTDGLAEGGYTTSSQTGHVSMDFPYGPTPVSVSVSTTIVATHGVSDFLSGYSLSGLANPSVHGLL